MKENCLKGFLKKSVCVGASALILGATVVVSPAAIQPAEAAEATGEDVSTYVSCASSRAAEPTPEILGIDNVTTNNAVIARDWSNPYLYFFGTEYNSNPDPYLVNTLSGVGTGLVVGESRKGGPQATMYDYSTAKEFWDQLPDIILGNSGSKNYNTADYALAAAEANNAPNYKTYGYTALVNNTVTNTNEATGGQVTNDYGVGYNNYSIFTMLNSMYDLSSAAKLAADSTGKKLRYGDSDSATEITAGLEEYVKGAQGYVLEQLAKEGKSKKKVACIYGYDKETNTYQIIPTGKAEGTATQNRYLEAVKYVATNIADSKETQQAGSGRNAATVATATAAEIADCDLILVGSLGAAVANVTSNEIVSSLPTDVLKKTYWVDSDRSSAGSCYGVVMNSVENAQNTGRILPCLYPEYLDQSDMIAYYYQNFYHITTGKVAEAVASAMDGVRNWNVTDGSSSEAINWEENDLTGYSAYATESKLDEGMKYVRDNASKLDSEAAADLAATSQYKGTKTAYTTVSAKTSAEKTANTLALSKSKVTVKKGKKATVKITKYKGTLTVKSSNKKVATVSRKGKTITIKGVKKGSATITVKAAGNGDYKAGTKKIKVTVKKA